VSYVEIYAVDQRGDVYFYDEVHNAGGGALLMWMRLGEDYGNPFPIMNDKPWWKWANESVKNGTFSNDDAWVYAISCDWGIIPPEHMDTAIFALEAFYSRHPHTTGDGIVAVLRRANDDPAVYGICFNHTSVVADPIWRNWQNWDEDENGDPPPYNVYTMNDGHWWIGRER
jgi:hypothetical protein